MKNMVYAFNRLGELV